MGDRSQTIDAARSRFKHAQDSLLHSRITDQLGLIDAAMLAQDVTVECRANRGFHLQDPRVEVVVDAAVIAVDVSIKSMAIARNRNARPVGAIVAVCAIARAGLRHGSVSDGVAAIRADVFGRWRFAFAIFPRRPHPFAPVFRNRPCRHCWRLTRLPALVKIDPDRSEVIEVSSEPKTGTSPLERLGVGRSHPVVVVGPLLAGSGVRPKTNDRDRTGDQDLAGDDGLALLHPGYVVHGFDAVTARPALR